MGIGCSFWSSRIKKNKPSDMRHKNTISLSVIGRKLKIWSRAESILLHPYIFEQIFCGHKIYFYEWIEREHTISSSFSYNFFINRGAERQKSQIHALAIVKSGLNFSFVHRFEAINHTYYLGGSSNDKKRKK